MTLTSDSKEFIELLLEHGVEFVVVGGHAVGFHGYPRYTGDLDFLVRTDELNQNRLVLLLKQFGFEGLGLTEADFANPETVIQLGHPPNRIDLLTSIDGVTFEEVWETRVYGDLGGITVPFPSLEVLLRAKRSSGRPQDLSDIQILENL